MSTFLSIQISSDSIIKKERIVFFKDEFWNDDSQLKLLKKIHELIEIAKPYGNKLNVNVKIDSVEAEYLSKIIKKRSRLIPEINPNNLTNREIEIVGLLMQGLSSEEIAEKLFICYETVKTHRKHILQKTGAKNTAALINYYHQTFFEK